MDTKKILGQYPRDMDDSESDVFQPGIAIPTTPWDAVWNGITSRWLGITSNNSADLDEVIPNRRGTFTNLFGKEELFKTWPSQSTIGGGSFVGSYSKKSIWISTFLASYDWSKWLLAFIISIKHSFTIAFLRTKRASLPSPNSTDDFKFSSSDCVRIGFHFNSIILVLNLFVFFL